MNREKDEVNGFRKEIRGIRYCSNCIRDENGQNRLKSFDGNAAGNILIKGKFLMENRVDHPGFSRHEGKMAEKFDKFYPTDSNCPHMKMKTCIGPRHHHTL